MVLSDLRALRAAGRIEPRPRGGRERNPTVRQRRQRVVSSYDGTKTDQELASELGVYPMVLSDLRALRAAGRIEQKQPKKVRLNRMV